MPKLGIVSGFILTGSPNQPRVFRTNSESGPSFVAHRARHEMRKCSNKREKVNCSERITEYSNSTLQAPWMMMDIVQQNEVAEFSFVPK
jgi:hypothetical protein